jgi:hypothetical protein
MCQGCQGTGFVGRTGVFEMIVLTDELRKAVKQVKQLPELGMQFRRAKMLYLQEQALRKVIAGTTAINEMLRVLAAGKKEAAEAPSEKGWKWERKCNGSLVMLTIMAGCRLLCSSRNAGAGHHDGLQRDHRGLVAFGFQDPGPLLVKYSPGIAVWAPLICFVLLLVWRSRSCRRRRCSYQRDRSRQAGEQIEGPACGLVLGY